MGRYYMPHVWENTQWAHKVAKYRLELACSSEEFYAYVYIQLVGWKVMKLSTIKVSSVDCKVMFCTYLHTTHQSERWRGFLKNKSQEFYCADGGCSLYISDWLLLFVCLKDVYHEERVTFLIVLFISSLWNKHIRVAFKSVCCRNLSYFFCLIVHCQASKEQY